ncbi:hypothetical protein BP6252_13539 [Coleophoma cylindrospora]|uniref:Cyanovirin-N domain-containing protein n=1 Tax=Coleophoma cylindrospora TaxID=1849047 RepID=A0A3D8Q923_9HELO|nr:hypothetical protein BP6252_13539 [Coleophoma cylindrospora]
MYSLRFISALLAIPASVLAGDYSKTCGQYSTDPNDNTVLANCGDGHGGYRDSRMDMNLCLGNSGGTLVAQNNGGYHDTCYACGPLFDGPTTTFSCICGDGKGGWPVTSIDLNSVLGNIDGYLWCFDHRGT